MRLLRLGVAILIMLLCTACAKQADVNTYKQNKSEKTKIVLIGKGHSNKYWENVQEGAIEAASFYGIDLKFEFQDIEEDKEVTVKDQILSFKNAIEEKVDAICISSLDDEQCLKYYQEAKEEDIPVIAFESRTESDQVVATCSTDNYGSASLAADKMAEFILSGEIAIISHSKTSKSGIDRRDGFRYRILEEYKDITIVDIQYSNDDLAKAESIAKSILEAYPNLKGIFGTSESTMIGIINAVKGLKRDDVKLVGFDSGQIQIDAVIDGIQLGFIAQEQKQLGYKVIETAVKAAGKSKIDPVINIGYEWIDIDNIYDEELQSILYE